MLALIVLSLSLGAPPAPSAAYADLVRDPASPAESARVDAVLDHCPRARRELIDPFAVLALVRLEDQLGVPAEARGLLPAVWCIESAFRPAERLYGDVGRALGPAQFHEPHAKTCMGDYRVRGKDWRADFVFSARCWITLVNRNLAKAAERCGSAKAWQVAEAVVSNVVRYGWRCDSRSSHWRLAERFREVEAARRPTD